VPPLASLPPPPVAPPPAPLVPEAPPLPPVPPDPVLAPLASTVVSLLLESPQAGMAMAIASKKFS
jgi:hypothetical protein